MSKYDVGRKRLPLFDPPPAQEHSSTSRAAAVQIEASAGTLREQVLAHIRRKRQFGATDQEIQRALDMDPSTQRPRRVELCNAGLVVDSGRTQPTDSGRQATVWIATEWKR